MSKDRKDEVNFQNRHHMVYFEQRYMSSDKLWPDKAIDVRQEARDKIEQGTKDSGQKMHWCQSERKHSRRDRIFLGIFVKGARDSIYATYASISIYCLHRGNCCNLEHELVPDHNIVQNKYKFDKFEVRNPCVS